MINPLHCKGCGHHWRRLVLPDTSIETDAQAAARLRSLACPVCGSVDLEHDEGGSLLAGYLAEVLS